MNDKWMAIAIAVFFVASAIGMAASQYFPAKCKQAYANSTRTADEIIKVCGK